MRPKYEGVVVGGVIIALTAIFLLMCNMMAGAQ